jgi:hypothetical protein
LARLADEKKRSSHHIFEQPHSAAPDAAAPGPRTNQQLSDAQKEHQEHFRQAILYAKSAKDTPEYKDVADARGQSTFNVAVADFLHPPEIQQIDLSAYKGAPGEIITITAVDDIKVKTVGILIVNDDGTLVEKGTAIPTTDANSWLYKTTATAASASVKVVVDVAVKLRNRRCTVDDSNLLQCSLRHLI